MLRATTTSKPMTVEARTATPQTAGRPVTGMRGKLWIAFVLQIAAISVATLLSVYGSWIVLRDVLVQRALAEEAAHYWDRYARDPAAQLPDTYNMRGYLAPPGTDGDVPARLGILAPGYHAIDIADSNDLVYVSDGPGGRLYLVFKQEQVDKLALWFGFVPLTAVLGVIYFATWLTYRISRRAISPVIWLANQVRNFDPKRPDLDALRPANLPSDADGDVRVLATSIHGFASRLEHFVERERNFTRDASHELRTPLTVVKVAADVLAEEEGLSPFATRSVERVRRAVRDMEALIESFLILARETDVGLPEEDFVVNLIAAEELEKAQAMVTGKPVALQLVEEAQFALHAPTRVLAVMLSNLLRNACLYTESGSVVVTVGANFVSVRDTGPGMPADELARAFEPFYRGGRVGPRGHGIGLTIVRRLSERFGWPVTLDSAPGVGTTATIRFPSPQPV
jgi:signal transduction histidine kinase